MKILFELAHYNIQYKEVVRALSSHNASDYLDKLIEIVFSGNIIDDQSAMLLIYGKNNTSSFSKLKSKLQDILINTAILQGDPFERENSRLNHVLMEFRHTIGTRFLYGQKRNIAIHIAEKTLSKSIKHNGIENVILIVRILIRYYGSHQFNRFKLKKYLEIQEKYLRIHTMEIKAENYFLDLHRTQLYSLEAPSHALKIKAKMYVDELNQITDIDTFWFLNFKYKLQALYFEYIKDYESLLNLSEKAIQTFSKQPFRSNLMIYNINLRRSWALIQCGNNNDAITIGLKDRSLILEGSISWFFISHYTLKAMLYMRNYLGGIDLISQMINNSRFNQLSPNYQELFTTTLGYIHLIVDSGLAGEFQRKEGILPKFRLYKFLNSTPVFNKDKRGINVSILLMHIAFLLQRKDYNAIIDRIDSLKQYAYKYLRKDDTFRSNCMIKMVLQMTRADFNPVRTERYTKDLFNQLQEVKLAGSGENIETEIIPHEVLWDIMLRALKQPDKVKVALRE